jgi:hypothetical protein
VSKDPVDVQMNEPDLQETSFIPDISNDNYGDGNGDFSDNGFIYEQVNTDAPSIVSVFAGNTLNRDKNESNAYDYATYCPGEGFIDSDSYDKEHSFAHALISTESFVPVSGSSIEKSEISTPNASSGLNSMYHKLDVAITPELDSELDEQNLSSSSLLAMDIISLSPDNQNLTISSLTNSDEPDTDACSKLAPITLPTSTNSTSTKHISKKPRLHLSFSNVKMHLESDSEAPTISIEEGTTFISDIRTSPNHTSTESIGMMSAPLSLRKSEKSNQSRISDIISEFPLEEVEIEGESETLKETLEVIIHPYYNRLKVCVFPLAIVSEENVFKFPKQWLHIVSSNVERRDLLQYY